MADLNYPAPIQYEPKLNSRFFLRFPTDIGIQTWAVESVTSPKIKINTKDLSFVNTKTYYQTSFEWEAITIKVRDFLAPNQMQAVMEWVRLSSESVTGRMGYHIGHAKDLEIDLVDPTGRIASKWRLEKCIISGTVQHSDLQYADGEIIKIDLPVQPQRAILLF